MSKLICDVCGTTYPETATQCPICSSAKNSAEQTAAAESGQKIESASSGYTYVKGGRFSKKNVRRRTRGGSAAQRHSAPQEEEPKNTGLIVVVVLLLLAIAAVVIYIGVKYVLPDTNNNKPDNTDGTSISTNQTSEATTSTSETEDRIACESLTLSTKHVEFFAEGETWTIIVESSPADTTDGVDFTSSDPSVATVSHDGVVTAVGYGETEIVVTCGDISQSCMVVCSFGEPTVDPSDVPTEPSGEFVFEFNTPYVDATTGYGDTTLNKQGEIWKAYKSSLSVDPADITWISDDPAVCTVENGVVTAVGPGKTKVHAQYNGVTYTCLVRCSFTVTESGSDTQGGEGQTGDCTINHQDVTIAVDETFTLTLKDADGNVLDVNWTASAGNVSIDGNKITGVSSGKVEVSTTYDGVTYSCTVRVK